MRYSLRKGFGFGLASGVITTLGLMLGLYAGTHSTMVLVGGILSIAIADSFSDALGIHISEEAVGKFTVKEIWEVTIATLIFKFLFAFSFLIPILLLPLSAAMIVSIVWGLLLLTIFSIYMANVKKINPLISVFEHLSIAVFVIVVTYYVGSWISSIFGYMK